MLPSTTRQKIFRAGFWVLLFYIAITSTVVIAIQFQLVPVPSRTSAEEEEKKQATEQLDMSETSFAKLFAREFLSWTKGDEQSRAIRLEPFWQNGRDVQGGLNFEQTEWNSYPQNVEVWQIKDRPNEPGVKEVTVYAETYLSKVDNAEQQKRVDRYLVVPIKKAGASYLVVDTPYFIAPPVASSLPKQEKAEEQGETVELSVKADIEKFLPSFWKSYTGGSAQELGYLMKGNKVTSTLAGVMQFVESTKVEVRQKGEHYFVENDVVLTDLASQTNMSYHYQFKLVKENNRWFILVVQQGEGILK
jgi:hypothetical protein